MEETKNIVKNNLGFYSFGRYQSSQMDFQEVIGKKDYVEFGKKNDFPQELIRLYQTASPLHKALVDKKSQMIAGNFFNEEFLGQSIIDKAFYRNRGNKLDVIAKKMAFDLALSNSAYLNIIWNDAGDKIAKIEHVPFERVRAQKCFDDGRINWYVSRDWLDLKKPQNKPCLYSGYDPEFAKMDVPGSKSQILPIQIYSPGMDYYTLPAYHSSIDSLKSNYELNLFHLKSIQNGFQAGMMIINKGEYTPEEQDDLYYSIKQKYTGAENAGDFIMMFVPDESMSPDIVPISLQATDERYLNLKESIVEDIIEGHQATSPVAGREVSGKLGSRNEIEEAYDLFQMTVINPYQNVVEDTFDMLAETNGLESRFILNKYNAFVVIDGEEGVPVANDKEADARAALRGSVGGVQGIIQIQTSVAAGTTSRDSAAALLELIYGFAPDEAIRLLGNVQEDSQPANNF